MGICWDFTVPPNFELVFPQLDLFGIPLHLPMRFYDFSKEGCCHWALRSHWADVDFCIPLKSKNLFDETLQCLA